MFKRKYFIILFSILVSSILKAQPYYYTAKYELVDSAFKNYTSDIYRINMSNPAVVETLLTNVEDLVFPKSDEYGNWLAYEEPFRLLTIMNLNNPNLKNVISQYSELTKKLSYSQAANKLVVLYLGNYPDPYKLVLVDPATLTITDTVPNDICWECRTAQDIVFSKTGDIMYLMKTDTS